MRPALPAALLSLSLALCAPRAHAFVWPNVPDEIARAMGADDPAERRAAAARLRELPAGLAAPLVLRALDDTDIEVRLVAGRAAVAFRVAGAGARVLGWLGEADPRIRLTACELLRTSPTPHALAPLARVLGDANADVRLAAATTLGMMGAREAVAALLGHLDDPSPEVRTGIVLALGRIGDARAVVPLLGKVQDGSVEVRRHTVRVLGDLGDPRAASALLLALRDKAVAVQIEAVESLGRLKASDATSAVAAMLSDRSAPPRLRNAALFALGRIGTPAALDALVGALAGDDLSAEHTPVRDALVGVGEPVVPRMVSALGGAGSPGAAAGACLVLAELGGADRSRLVAEALQRGRVPAHVGLRALGMLGDPSALPSALELLEAPSGLVRKAAFEAAAALLDPARPDGRAVDPIVTQLSRPRVALEDRVALARLLGRTGSPRAAPMLGALAGVKEPELRLEAIAALGQLASGGQDQVLLEALDDEDVRVRLAAATSLGRVAGSSAALALLRRLTAASEQDRGAVGIALSGAMARTTDAPAVAMVARLLPAVGEASRDVLIEGLGRMPSPRAAELLASLAERSVSADDRRKVAEAAAGHPEMASLARRLAVDPDPSVQANAVWSLGEVGDATDRPLLDGMLAHRDVAVAGNAAGALGRLLRRGLPTDPAALCKALDDPRTYVRANVLGALTVAARRCGDGERERQLLVFDPSPVVRSGAARLVRAVAAADAAADARALRRCRFDDRVGAVAAGCRERRAAEAPAPARDRVDPTLVFVVPDGRTAPAPRAPFALVRADGLMRLGIADRRGALFELRAPRGKVSLAVPATLVR